MVKIIQKNTDFVKIFLTITAIVLIFSIGSAPALAQNTFQLIQFEKNKEELPAGSPFLDTTPRIDEEAASVEKEDTGRKNYEILLDSNGQCQTLPQNLWVMLLGTYIFLLLFNLAYEFEKRRKLQWFWEALYTVLALLAWYNFDECRKNSWFAQSVIINGLIIYSFYLYFWLNKIKKSEPKPKPENERQEKLDLK